MTAYELVQSTQAVMSHTLCRTHKVPAHCYSAKCFTFGFGSNDFIMTICMYSIGAVSTQCCSDSKE